jgi:hypothetical protein
VVVGHSFLREKEDIQDLKTESSLKRILALKPKHYRKKFHDDGVRQYLIISSKSDTTPTCGDTSIGRERGLDQLVRCIRDGEGGNSHNLGFLRIQEQTYSIQEFNNCIQDKLCRRRSRVIRTPSSAKNSEKSKPAVQHGLAETE